MAMSRVGGIQAELLLHSDTVLNPYSFYRQLVSEAPVWRVGDTDVFTVSSHEAVVEASKRTEDFSSHLRYALYRDERGLPARRLHVRADVGEADVLATADPPVHARHKKIISPEFSPIRIASLESQVAAMTRDGLAAGLASRRMEFMSGVANPIPIEIITSLIAFKGRNTEALLNMAHSLNAHRAAAISQEELEDRIANIDGPFVWVLDQLKEACRQPGEGILGLLARAMNEGEIDLTVAMSILMTFFAAGGESTSSLIGSAVHMLAQDRDLQQRLRENCELIPKFVEEALRLESPLSIHMRLANRTSQLCDVQIPEGATLLLLWGAANRDPSKFASPDEVDLERPRQHVGFGSGIHLCIGNTLARLEVKVVLDTLLSSTKMFRLDETDTATWVPSLFVRRLQNLPILLEAA
jgi:cytochrome P450